MGMFDDIRCKYPLPVDGANELDYQTKDTPAQYLDKYEIREDGTLWHEVYDTEDHSNAAQWLSKNPGKELPKELDNLSDHFIGCMARINKRWEIVNFTGEIRFYTALTEEHKGWIEWSAYFEDGKIVCLNLIEHQKV